MKTQTSHGLFADAMSVYPIHVIDSSDGETREETLTKLADLGYKLFHLQGSTIDSKETLLDALATEMRFPDYFGNNWDALEECMRDLMEWIPASGYVVFL